MTFAKLTVAVACRAMCAFSAATCTREGNGGAGAEGVVDTSHDATRPFSCRVFTWCILFAVHIWLSSIRMPFRATIITSLFLHKKVMEPRHSRRNQTKDCSSTERQREKTVSQSLFTFFEQALVLRELDHQHHGEPYWDATPPN